MDPYDFEYFCTAQFMKFGWESEVTKGSSDQGVDVQAFKEKNSHTVMILNIVDSNKPKKYEKFIKFNEARLAEKDLVDVIVILFLFIYGFYLPTF